MLKEAIIRKEKDGYHVRSEKGKNLGRYDTKEEAEKRLKTIEMFKHMDKNKKKAFCFHDKRHNPFTIN